MSDRVSYARLDEVAWIVLDDGKANAINGPMLDGLEAAFDRAESDRAASVVLSGRPGFFSGGLDLKIIPTLPPEEKKALLIRVVRMVERLYRFPRPVVGAATGHALAGGALLLFCCDVKLGADGPYKIGLNEVAVGIPIPTFMIEMAQRVLPGSSLVPVLLHGRTFSPAQARGIGLLDEVVAADSVPLRAEEIAKGLAALTDPAYVETKRRMRPPAADPELLVADLERFFS